MDRLRQQLAFLLEVDRQKEIIRQTYLADGCGARMASGYDVHDTWRVCK